MIKYTGIIDTHAHYESAGFNEDRDILLNSLFEENIAAIVNISTNHETIDESLKLAEKYTNLYTSIGYHPDEAAKLNDTLFEDMRVKATHEKAVTIGEIGLDYYWDKSPRDIQQHWFRRQIELALSLNMPINIHSRDAAKDTFDILHEYYPDRHIQGIRENASDYYVPGVFHCYSYSSELAVDALNMGFMLGIGGVVTFSNAKKLLNVVEEAPLDRLVLETDCPYLAPVPHRGERNNSGYLQLVVEKISEIKGLSVEQVINATTENALRLYPKIKYRYLPDC